MKDEVLLNDKKEKLTSKDKLQMWGVVAVFILVLFLCLFLAYQVRNMEDNAATSQEQSATAALSGAPTGQTESTFNQEQFDADVDYAWSVFFYYLPWVAGGIFVLWILSKIAKSTQGQTIFLTLALLALVMGVGWWYIIGDKTGDGAGDSMVIAPAQLTGDPAVDSAYVPINDGSAMTNIKNMGAGLMVIVGVLVAILVVALVPILIKSRG